MNFKAWFAVPLLLKIHGVAMWYQALLPIRGFCRHFCCNFAKCILDIAFAFEEPQVSALPFIMFASMLCREVCVEELII